MHFGHSHTAGDASAYLPKHKILCTGDACVNGAFNFMGHSNSASWIKCLEAMDKLDIDLVCPGTGRSRGKSCSLWRRSTSPNCAPRLKKGIDDKKSVADITSGLDFPWYKEWTGVAVAETAMNKDNVKHVYDELMGKIDHDRSACGRPRSTWARGRTPPSRGSDASLPSALPRRVVSRSPGLRDTTPRGKTKTTSYPFPHDTLARPPHARRPRAAVRAQVRRPRDDRTQPRGGGTGTTTSSRPTCTRPPSPTRCSPAATGSTSAAAPARSRTTRSSQRKLAARARRFVGVDPSPNVHDNPFTREKRQAFIEDYASSEPFDVATLRMVAEHVTSPDAVVDALARLVKPGGRVIVFTVDLWSPITVMSRVVPFGPALPGEETALGRRGEGHVPDRVPDEHAARVEAAVHPRGLS